VRLKYRKPRSGLAVATRHYFRGCADAKRMQTFETLFLTCTFLLLVTTWLAASRQRLRAWLAASGLVLLAMHVIAETPRWQTGLSWLLLAILTVLLLRRGSARRSLRITGMAGGLLLLAFCLWHGIGMPVLDWPAPDGAHGVGTTRFCLTDRSRREIHAPHANRPRELFVEVWYPARRRHDEDAAAMRASLWRELYRGPTDQVSLFTGYLRGVPTSARPDAAADLQRGPFPVILFNHGLQMFPAQNTRLMEHLASHGYVIASVAHPYECLRVNLQQGGTVLPPFLRSWQGWRDAQSWIRQTSAPVLQARARLDDEPLAEDRARIMLAAIQDSPVNGMVARWESDTRFVLDYLMSREADTQPFAAVMDRTRVAVMGMSVGGAVAAELSRSDDRVKVAINIDGLQYGRRHQQPLTVPFLMLYSEDGVGGNEFLRLASRHDFHEVFFQGTRHADFSDLPCVWPLLRWYGQLGRVPGEQMMRLTNDVIVGFLDHYLKGQPWQPPAASGWPGLQVKSWWRDKP
jgi:predicted dienelactone hydrolase